MNRDLSLLRAGTVYAPEWRGGLCDVWRGDGAAAAAEGPAPMRRYWGRRLETHHAPNWFTAFCAMQAQRIAVKTAPAMARSRARRQARLSETYDEMHAETSIATHATGRRKPTMDGESQ